MYHPSFLKLTALFLALGSNLIVHTAPVPQDSTANAQCDASSGQSCNQVSNVVNGVEQPGSTTTTGGANPGTSGLPASANLGQGLTQAQTQGTPAWVQVQNSGTAACMAMPFGQAQADCFTALGAKIQAAAGF